jgi:Mn2+/Fe2+ NRAMP family transporter
MLQVVVVVVVAEGDRDMIRDMLRNDKRVLISEEWQICFLDFFSFRFNAIGFDLNLEGWAAMVVVVFFFLVFYIYIFLFFLLIIFNKVKKIDEIKSMEFLFFFSFRVWIFLTYLSCISPCIKIKKQSNEIKYLEERFMTIH